MRLLHRGGCLSPLPWRVAVCEMPPTHSMEHKGKWGSASDRRRAKNLNIQVFACQKPEYSGFRPLAPFRCFVPFRCFCPAIQVFRAIQVFGCPPFRSHSGVLRHSGVCSPRRIPTIQVFLAIQVFGCPAVSPPFRCFLPFRCLAAPPFPHHSAFRCLGAPPFPHHSGVPRHSRV